MDNEALSFLGKYFVAPLGAFILWAGKSQIMRIGRIEEKLHEVDKQLSVISEQLESLREDLKGGRRNAK